MLFKDLVPVLYKNNNNNNYNLNKKMSIAFNIAPMLCQKLLKNKLIIQIYLDWMDPIKSKLKDIKLINFKI